MSPGFYSLKTNGTGCTNGGDRVYSVHILLANLLQALTTEQSLCTTNIARKRANLSVLTFTCPRGTIQHWYQHQTFWTPGWLMSLPLHLYPSPTTTKSTFKSPLASSSSYSLTWNWVRSYVIHLEVLYHLYFIKKIKLVYCQYEISNRLWSMLQKIH